MRNRIGKVYFFIILLFIASIVSSNILQAYSCYLKCYEVEEVQSATYIKSLSHDKEDSYYRVSVSKITFRNFIVSKLINIVDTFNFERVISHTIELYFIRVKSIIISMEIPDLIYPFNSFF